MCMGIHRDDWLTHWSSLFSGRSAAGSTASLTAGAPLWTRSGTRRSVSRTRCSKRGITPRALFQRVRLRGCGVPLTNGVRVAVSVMRPRGRRGVVRLHDITRLLAVNHHTAVRRYEELIRKLAGKYGSRPVHASTSRGLPGAVWPAGTAPSSGQARIRGCARLSRYGSPSPDRSPGPPVRTCFPPAGTRGRRARRPRPRRGRPGSVHRARP